MNGIGNAQQCQQTTVNKTVFEKYTCERDVWVEQSCARNGTAAGGYGDPVVTTKTITINPGDWSISNRIMSFTVPEDMVVTSGTLKMDTPAWMLDARGTFMGTSLTLSYSQTFTLKVSGSVLKKVRLSLLPSSATVTAAGSRPLLSTVRCEATPNLPWS